MKSPYKKALQKINKEDWLVSIDFNSLYPSAQIDESSIWPKKKIAYPFEKRFMSESNCSLFNSERWDELNRKAFLT